MYKLTYTYVPAIYFFHIMMYFGELSTSDQKGLPNFFFLNILFIYLFLCGPFLKSLLNLLQYCFCFMFWFFGQEACGILAPWPGIEPLPPALEGKVLTMNRQGSPYGLPHF